MLSPRISEDFVLQQEFPLHRSLFAPMFNVYHRHRSLSSHSPSVMAYHRPHFESQLLFRWIDKFRILNLTKSTSVVIGRGWRLLLLLLTQVSLLRTPIFLDSFNVILSPLWGFVATLRETSSIMFYELFPIKKLSSYTHPKVKVWFMLKVQNQTGICLIYF